LKITSCLTIKNPSLCIFNISYLQFSYKSLLWTDLKVFTLKNDTPLPKPLSTEAPSNPKEISWLAFNERVLQEAENPEVPLIERLRYLGIFSNNMDEFFRVKIANLKRLINFSSGKNKEESDKLYKKIKKKIIKLQKRFDATYLHIIQELRNQQIYLVDEAQIREHQVLFIKEYFSAEILPSLPHLVFGFVYKNAIPERWQFLSGNKFATGKR